MFYGEFTVTNRRCQVLPGNLHPTTSPTTVEALRRLLCRRLSSHDVTQRLATLPGSFRVFATQSARLKPDFVRDLKTVPRSQPKKRRPSVTLSALHAQEESLVYAIEALLSKIPVPLSSTAIWEMPSGRKASPSSRRQDDENAPITSVPTADQVADRASSPRSRRSDSFGGYSLSPFSVGVIPKVRKVATPGSKMKMIARLPKSALSLLV